MSSDIHNFGYRAPRFRADFHLLVQIGDRPPSILDGRCTEISEDGLAAQFRTLLEVGSTVNLIFTLPGSSASIRIAARVTNRRGDSHGFAFVLSSQMERDHIHEYIESFRLKTFPMSSAAK